MRLHLSWLGVGNQLYSTFIRAEGAAFEVSLTQGLFIVIVDFFFVCLLSRE